MNQVSKHQFPSVGVAWYMVILLTVAYIFSFVDRYILGLLIEPIKADLGLSDTQIGLLLGPAFAIFYATMGLPLGWLADRKRRTWIVAAGVALWSIATAASGMAKNFTHLFIARMSVGVGEATLSPCAMSMISDSFPKERRAKPIAFYTMALSLGAGIASLVSAGVLQWAKSVPAIDLPVLGVVAPWQFTFIVVGLPGVVLALLMLTLREPNRQSIVVNPDHVGSDRNNITDMLRHIARHWKVFIPFISVFCYMTILAYSQGWGAPLFQRTWGWEASQYATVNAVILLAVGPATVNFAGWLSDRWTRQGIADAPVRIALIGVVVMILSGVVAPLLPSPWVAIGVYGVNTSGIAMASAVGVTALLNISPAAMRAQIVAFYYMCISLAGLLLGPTSIALLNDYVFGVENIRYSMALVPLAFGLPVLLMAGLIRRKYIATQAHFEAIGQN
ncbi:MAG TPA: MFS transporter [Xanthomonadales bacterium]|nr:MFS transporter [Xanthomonadales bacterium]